MTVVSAADVLSDRFDPGGVFEVRGHDRRLGAELGGLRSTSFDPLTPSVLVHADVFLQLMRGYAPRAPAFAFTVQLVSRLPLRCSLFWLRSGFDRSWQR